MAQDGWEAWPNPLTLSSHASLTRHRSPLEKGSGLQSHQLHRARERQVKGRSRVRPLLLTAPQAPDLPP